MDRKWLLILGTLAFILAFVVAYLRVFPVGNITHAQQDINKSVEFVLLESCEMQTSSDRCEFSVVGVVKNRFLLTRKYLVSGELNSINYITSLDRCPNFIDKMSISQFSKKDIYKYTLALNNLACPFFSNTFAWEQ